MKTLHFKGAGSNAATVGKLSVIGNCRGDQFQYDPAPFTQNAKEEAETMEYELINPSDKYTFIAEDFETAVLAVFLLGTAYGAEPRDGGEEVPIFLFGGAKEWYAERFGRAPDDGLDEKKRTVADALLSFMLGDFEDRRRYELALAAIDDPEKKDRFVDEWQDGRSSLNNIGSIAHKLGRVLKTEAETKAEIN